MTCKHNKYIDYVWKRDKYDRETDELLHKYCHTCGVEIKIDL